MASLTRQDVQRDVQTIVDQARVKFQDQIASKQDIQVLHDAVKQLTANMQQTQQLLRQGDNQYVQIVRRSSSVESRMTMMEHELQQLQSSMSHLVEQPPTEKVTERVIVASTEEQQQRYIYNPARTLPAR